MVTATQRTKQLLQELGHEPARQEKIAIAKQVKQEIGKGSEALVNKVLKRMPKPKSTEARESVVAVGEGEAVELPVVVEEVAETTEEKKKKPETSEEADRIVAKAEAGMLEAEDITYLWKAVNGLFPEKHQRPEKAIDVLGKIWAKPANRLIEKYADENIDLFLALGVTVLTFTPSIKGVLTDRMKPKKEKKEE